jgi:hypothetical protein
MEAINQGPNPTLEEVYKRLGPDFEEESTEEESPQETFIENADGSSSLSSNYRTEHPFVMELPPETNRMLQQMGEAINQQSQKSDRKEEIIRQIRQRIILNSSINE